jgi:hypothetical protein
MNEKKKQQLYKTIKTLNEMTDDEFFMSLYGYTLEQKNAYTVDMFNAELEYLRTFFFEGSYTFYPKYDDEVVPELSKLFWNYAETHARSNFQDTNAEFPTYYIELPQFGIRVKHSYGQVTLTTVEDFDYNTVEYRVRNASRLKREHAWNKNEELKNFMRDKPRRLDEVKFSTMINGVVVEDTGVIERFYTKKGILRYLIDSVNYGKIIVFYQNEDYINDLIEIVVLHPDNYGE